MKVWLISFFFLLVGTAVSYGQIDTLINVGTYKLHFKILEGKEAPILFESGGGLDASNGILFLRYFIKN